MIPRHAQFKKHSSFPTEKCKKEKLNECEGKILVDNALEKTGEKI
jgi:hypothetical protein